MTGFSAQETKGVLSGQVSAFDAVIISEAEWAKWAEEGQDSLSAVDAGLCVRTLGAAEAKEEQVGRSWLEVVEADDDLVSCADGDRAVVSNDASTVVANLMTMEVAIFGVGKEDSGDLLVWIHCRLPLKYLRPFFCYLRLVMIVSEQWPG